MRIDIWSDFACPFCYIGKRNLEKALEEFETSKNIDIVFHSFQLDPDAKKSNKPNSLSTLSKKYRISKEEAQKIVDRVVKMAEDVGLNYNYDKVIETNTFDAHRLVQYAKDKNKSKELIEKLFEAYFRDGLDIGEYDILGEIGENIGLDKEKVLEILEENRYASKVNNDIDLANELGITSVPFFVIDNKTAIPGAQPSNVFLEVLNESKNKDNIIH